MAVKQMTKTSTAKRGTTKRATASKAKTRTTNAATKSAGSRRQTNARRSQPANEFAQARTTTNHDEIRDWVEARDGYPATVIGTGDATEAGVLRIDYPGFGGEGTLERISWDEFFEKFDDADLVFLYQEETADGGPSRFSKLISRDQANSNARA